MAKGQKLVVSKEIFPISGIDVIVEPLLQEALVKINHITLDEALNVTLLYLIWLIVWFEYVNSELTLIV